MGCSISGIGDEEYGLQNSWVRLGVREDRDTEVIAPGQGRNATKQATLQAGKIRDRGEKQ